MRKRSFVCFGFEKSKKISAIKSLERDLSILSLSLPGCLYLYIFFSSWFC